MYDRFLSGFRTGPLTIHIIDITILYACQPLSNVTPLRSNSPPFILEDGCKYHETIGHTLDTIMCLTTFAFSYQDTAMNLNSDVQTSQQACKLDLEQTCLATAGHGMDWLLLFYHEEYAAAPETLVCWKVARGHHCTSISFSG